MIIKGEKASFHFSGNDLKDNLLDLDWGAIECILPLVNLVLQLNKAQSTKQEFNQKKEANSTQLRLNYDYHCHFLLRKIII